MTKLCSGAPVHAAATPPTAAQTDGQETNLVCIQPRQSKHKHFSYQYLGKVQTKPEAIADIHFSLLLLKLKRTCSRFIRDPEEQVINTRQAGIHQSQNAWEGVSVQSLLRLANSNTVRGSCRGAWGAETRMGLLSACTPRALESTGR